MKSEEFEFEEVQPTMWTPEKIGDQLLGVFVGKDVGVGVNESVVYRFETDDEIVSVWGSAVLDSRLRHIETGDVIRLTYLGEKESKKTGRTFKDFDIEKGTKKEEKEERVVLEDVKTEALVDAKKECKVE